jgi:hypothetical protein
MIGGIFGVAMMVSYLVWMAGEFLEPFLVSNGEI